MAEETNGNGEGRGHDRRTAMLEEARHVAEVIVEVSKKTGIPPIVIDPSVSVTTQVLNKVLTFTVIIMAAVLFTLGAVVWQIAQQAQLQAFERTVNMRLNCYVIEKSGWHHELCTDFIERRLEGNVDK